MVGSFVLDSIRAYHVTLPLLRSGVRKTIELTVEVCADGPVRVLRVTDREVSVLKMAPVPEPPPPLPLLSVALRLGGLGVSVVELSVTRARDPHSGRVVLRGRRRELLYCSAKGIKADYSNSTASADLEVTVQNVQVRCGRLWARVSF